jgi:hypothetical protein
LDTQQGGSLWVLRNTRLSMLRSFFLRFILSLLLVFVLVVVASAIVLANVQVPLSIFIYFVFHLFISPSILYWMIRY